MSGKKLISSLFVLASILIPLSTSTIYAENEDTIKDYIDKFYVDEVDESLLKKDLDTIFDQLDPYSTYFTKEEYKSFKDGINQKFVGIGVGIKKVENGILLSRVFPDSPAKKAGLKSGDIILSADGTSLKELSIEKAVTHIKGEAGTSVNLTVLHDSNKKEVTVQRAKIQLPSVEAKQLGGHVGYIQLYTFGQETLTELQDATSDLEGVEHWILDVRNNPGGYLTASQQVLGFFENVPSALIAEYRNKSLTYEPLQQDFTFSKPVYLLMNENSASASEILAGALQDHNAATLYGSTTFGKGLLQELLMLPNGGAVKLSTARFFTPDHNKIQGVGISPDIQSEHPLATAHKDALQNAYNYKTFEKDQVSPDKTFEINLSEPIQAQKLTNSIDLVEIGGKEVEYSLSLKDEDTILLDPESELSSDQDYSLLVHPGWRTKDGETSKKGVIQPIHVE